MKRFVVLLSLSLLTHCGFEPVTCGCLEVYVLTDNGTRIAGSTIRIVVPDRPPSEGVEQIIPGAFVIGDSSFCRTGSVAFEVSHPQYRTQRVDVTIPRNLEVGSSGACSVPRPPPAVVRLVPNS
jgi:hypothetical protein